MHSTDILVLGGGPAGAAASVAASRDGAKTMLVDDGGARVRLGECLPADASPLLSRLGLSNWLRDHAAYQGAMTAWSSEELVHVPTVFNPYGSGWRLDRTRLNADLLRWAEDAGVVVLTSTRFVSSQRESTGFSAVVEQHDQRQLIKASRVVDATGRRAAFAREQGAKRKLFDNLTALVGVLPKTKDDVSGCLTLEAVEYGWWYTIGLQEDVRIVALMTDPDLLRDLTARDPARWIALLQETVHVSLACHAGDGPPTALHVVPANTGLSDLVCGDGWAAAGDAAASYDPLSSQGVMSALASGWSAGQALALANEDRHRAHVTEVFQSYRRNWSAHYRSNKRWPDAPFWRRRGSMTQAMG